MTHANAVVVLRRLFGLLLLGFVVSAQSPLAWADPEKPNAVGWGRMTLAEQKAVAIGVTTRLPLQHLTRHPLDKEISERCLKNFLKTLDPRKMYFYQSDADSFGERKFTLAERAKKGDINFAYTVFKVFLERVDERVKMVDQLLAMQHDFTVDEEMVVDKDKITYARTPDEALEKWRKWIKYELLTLKLEKTEAADVRSRPEAPPQLQPPRKPGDKAEGKDAVEKRKPGDKAEGKDAVEKLRRRYHSFSKRMHQIDSDELLEMFLTALGSAYDPHTSYMSPPTLDNFEIAMRLELEGIGAALQTVDGYTVVKQLIPEGVAEKDGHLKLEDKIVGVAQNSDGEMVDTVDMKLQDVVKMIRGKAGTIVRLAVISPDSPEQKIINLTRDKIELKDSEARSQIFEAGHRPDGTPYKVGVIDLPSFYMDMTGVRRGLSEFKSTTRDVQKILENFNSKKVDAVVLDLRRNGGGSLTEAINLTGLFVHDRPVVQVKDYDGLVRPYRDLDPALVWSGPLVVLTSKLSASASEILAGAIQDYGRGLIVGDQSTHGKGTVQTVLDIGQQLIPINPPPMGALKITVQQFYRPNGESTQKRGVLADIELPAVTSHLDVGEADLDYAVEFDKVAPVEFKRFGHVNPAIRDQLRGLSQQRCSHSEKFQQELKKIVRYEEQKARKTVTLNEEKFLKERAELNADKEEEKKLQELDSPTRAGIERDYYLDEVLAITADYLNLKQVAKAN
jgi:carboxyl-terminal processing protease